METSGLSYNRLFNTQFLHTFYVDGISKKDLAVAPTPSTVTAMKNNNMLFRNDEGGFRVLYKADQTGAPFINFSNVRLVFALQLLNLTEFINFTDLSDGAKAYTAGKILYFTNRGSVTTSDLTYSLLDYLRPVTFTYTFPQTATNTSDLGFLTITNQAGTDVTPATPPASNIAPNNLMGYSYPIDFTKLPKGLYHFKTWTSTTVASPKTETIYIDTELMSQGVFGIVDLLAVSAADSSFPSYPTPPPSPDYRVYKMNFARRTTQWKYIVLLKSPGVTPPPAMKIVDTVAPVYPYTSIDFNDAVDTTVNGIPAKVITSKPPLVPYFETPKKGLTIKNTTTGDPLLENIPGPPIGVVSAQSDNFSITEIFVII